jgi:hypothetical protein
MIVSRGGVPLGIYVLAGIVKMGGLMVMMRGGVVMGGGLKVMFTRRMLH